MPRKKYGMRFDLLPRPTKGDDGKPLLYARPSIGIKYTMRTLDEFCNRYRGMHKGQLASVFETFIEVAAIHMENGERIETPIGSFAPRLRLDGDYTDPKQVKSNNVSLAGIEFIPSKRFLEALNDRVERGYLRTGEPTSTDQLRDPAQMDEALRKALLKRGYTTVNYFCYHSGLKYHTAKRYLNSLCEGENPRLRKTVEGRMIHYHPVDKQDKNGQG